MWKRLRDPLCKICRNSSCILLLVTWAIVCCTWGYLFDVQPAQAEQQTITVLIEETFQNSGSYFLEQLTENLVGQARESVRFVPTVVSPSEISARLREPSWNMAILSTSTLTDAKIRTKAVAFEMPFLFSSMGSVTALQHSIVGRAALSTMSEQGITGLVYLNAGITLMANRNLITTPNELKGRKVAVFSPGQEEPFKKLGAVPLLSQFANVQTAVDRGSVDSVAINSVNTSSWVFPAKGFLLTDSVEALVAVVVTQDKLWNEIPFVYRAMIGDAAIATAQKIDRSLVEFEKPLFDRAKSAGLSLVSFKAEDASRATEQWISEQPEALRAVYSSVYDYVKSVGKNGPQDPIDSGRRGEIGKLYFATTRDDTENSNFLYRFGDARTEVVKCGQIQFSQTNPSINGAAFLGLVTADTQACGAILAAALETSQRMFIFVHGFNNRFSEAAERAIILKNVLGNDTDVVVWSWPSKRDGLAGKYDYDKESVTGVAQRRLIDILRALRAASSGKPINILAHSMGGWHVLGALQTLSDDGGSLKLGNIVLAAPDIPDDEFRFALTALGRISKRNTLYACGWDWALILSQEINAYPRAGTGGNNIVVSRGMDSIDVDATFSLNHSYVFEAGKVLSDLTAVILSGVDPDAAPRNLREVPKASWHYWRFDR
jgi:esterase/lipase superfamily enzyme/TRAP-type C4-dicarboxylate transport system substrate-binding protein